MAITVRAGSSSAAAIAAGSAKPMVERPFDFSTSLGSSACQRPIAENMCAPESTVIRAPAGATRRTAVTTSSAVRPPGPVMARPARSRLRSAAISSSDQPAGRAFSIRANAERSRAPVSAAVGTAG